MISHATDIPYNPQGQTIVERTNRVIKELLARTISPEARQDPHLAGTEVLFHMNIFIFDDKRLSPVYKHWESRAKNILLSLVR